MTNVNDLESILRNNPDLAALLDRFAEIALPDARIVADSIATYPATATSVGIRRLARPDDYPVERLISRASDRKPGAAHRRSSAPAPRPNTEARRSGNAYGNDSPRAAGSDWAHRLAKRYACA